MKGYKKECKIPHYKRYCKVLYLKDDAKLIQGYRKAHEPLMVPRAVSDGLKSVGIIGMELFLNGNQVFMIMDTVPEFNHDDAMKKLAAMPAQAKWEMKMARYQLADGEEATPEKWKLLERIFLLE